MHEKFQENLKRYHLVREGKLLYINEVDYLMDQDKYNVIFNQVIL